MTKYAFRDFARKRLRASEFSVDRSNEKEHLFAASLETTQAHLAWTEGATNSAGEQLRIVPGFVDVFQPNALADRYEGMFFLAMHSSLHVSILELAMFCFTQANFMKEIGDPALESSPVPPGNKFPGLWLIDHTSKGGRVSDEHSRQRIPVCPIRYETSIFLGLLMSRFVWLHELVHAFNGHVSYVQDRGLALRLYEIPPPMPVVGFANDDPETTKSILQSLELEADQAALKASVNIQLRNLENIEGIAATSERDRLRLALFGCYAMTWLFDEYQSYYSLKDDETHPPPAVRLHGLLDYSDQDLANMVPDFEVLDADVKSQFEHARAAVPTLYQSSDLDLPGRSAQNADDLGNLQATLDSIQSDLDHWRFREARG